MRNARSFKLRQLEDGIACIRISRFDSALNELPAALSKSPASRGLVLDLRDTKGGDLISATEVYSIFMDAVDRQTPVIILLNGGTSGASETLVAALRSHRRVNLIGEKSSGGIEPDILSLNCCQFFQDRQLQCAKLLLQLDRLHIA